ncbi:helix-turn-helix domain-containing protein [Parafrankia sp. FMc2]|uniref:helix-turn-helix domain-containing protein n=1 Tax=Parafrankia sp. FMc2 TaxID=3233196 RepID=UPI0034D6BB4C
MDPETLAVRVREAIQRSGLTQRAVANAAGLDPTALSKVLAGRRRLSSLELALVAEVTGVPVDEILAADDREDVRIAARVQPAANPAVTEAMRRVDELLEIDGLLSDVGLPAPPSRFPISVPDSSGRWVDQAGALAAEVRGLAGIGDGPIESLADFCEQRLGVDVAVEKLPPGLDGLSISRGNYRLALVNSATPATRQRYTLAHELGHVAFGDIHGIRLDEDLFGPERSVEERRANSFAAAFLMPVPALCRALGPAGTTEVTIGAMLAEFKVSLDALAFRLHNVELVDALGRDRVRQMSARRLELLAGHAGEYQRQLRSIGARRVPSGLLQRAVDAYNNGSIGVRVLARLMCVPEGALLRQLSPLPPMTDEELADDDPTLVL